MSAHASSISVSATGTVYPEARGESVKAPRLPDFISKRRYNRSSEPFQQNSARPFFLDFHILQSRGRFDYPSHRHTQYELILVQNGPYRCSLNGDFVELARGEALLIKPGDLHQDFFRAGQAHFVVHFQLYLGGSRRAPVIPLFQDDVSREQQVCRSDLSGQFDLIDEIAREADSAHPYASGIQDALLEVLFWRVIRNLPPEGLSNRFQQVSQDQDFLTRLYALFDAAVATGLPVPEMAARMGVSRRTLHQRVRRLTGSTPKAAFDRYRIDLARDLLKNPELSIKEISFRLGFANPYHFSRVFKRTTGAAPSTRFN